MKKEKDNPLHEKVLSYDDVWNLITDYFREKINQRKGWIESIEKEKQSLAKDSYQYKDKDYYCRTYELDIIKYEQNKKKLIENLYKVRCSKRK